MSQPGAATQQFFALSENAKKPQPQQHLAAQNNTGGSSNEGHFGGGTPVMQARKNKTGIT